MNFGKNYLCQETLSLALCVASWSLYGFSVFAALSFGSRRYQVGMLGDWRVRLKFAFRAMSMLHATAGTLVSAYSLYNDGASGQVRNTVLQDRLARFSQSYFCLDLLYTLLCDYNITFALHHVVGILINALVLYSGVGGYYLVTGIFLGEVTNPMQIVWMLARDHGFSKTHAFLSPIFTYFFLLARLVFVPIGVSYIIWHSLHQPHLSAGFVLSLSSLMLALTIGSWLWCWSLWRGYRKFIREKKPK